MESESGSEGAWDEIFGVVASPATGEVVRVSTRAPREAADPAALGRRVAAMLMEAGAAPLLAHGGEASGAA